MARVVDSKRVAAGKLTPLAEVANKKNLPRNSSNPVAHCSLSEVAFKTETCLNGGNPVSSGPNIPQKRPGWTESVPWMGLSLRAWWNLFRRHRFQAEVQHWPGALFDLTVAGLNSSLGLVQWMVHGRDLALHPSPEPPLFVVGHWRTGTTLMHELLALDPWMRSPSTFECLAPHHFVLTHGWLPRWTRFSLPATRSFDPMRVGWESPQEDEFALLLMGQESPYAAIAFPNGADRDDAALELDLLPFEELRRWKAAFQKFLTRLSFVRDGQLLLKSPTHTMRVPVLSELYPHARWLLMTRNPYETCASTIKLWKSLYSTYGYQTPDFSQLETRVVETFARFHRRWEATHSMIRRDHLVVVRYEDLVADPVATVTRVYESLNLGDPGEFLPAVRQYFADRADYQPNRHELPAALRAAIRDKCRGYFERHGYSLEDGRPASSSQPATSS